MTANEVKKLMAYIGAAYPNWPLLKGSDVQQKLAIAVWCEIFEPTDAQAAHEVVVALVRSDREFAPTPGVIFTRAQEISDRRESERNRAEVKQVATSIAQAAPRLEDGRLDYDWMYKELDRRRPELVLPRHAFDRDYAWTNAEIRANSRHDEFQMAIVDAAKDIERRLRLPPPAPNPRIANIVSEVSGRMGQAKPMTREEQEARVALIQKQAYELTRNGKVA